jgi:hypothetical protein
MISKGIEALDNNSVGLKVPDCVEEVGRGKSLNSFLVVYYILSRMRNGSADKNKCFDTIVMMVVWP